MNASQLIIVIRNQLIGNSTKRLFARNKKYWLWLSNGRAWRTGRIGQGLALEAVQAVCRIRWDEDICEDNFKTVDSRECEGFAHLLFLLDFLGHSKFGLINWNVCECNMYACSFPARPLQLSSTWFVRLLSSWWIVVLIVVSFSKIYKNDSAYQFGDISTIQ